VVAGDGFTANAVLATSSGMLITGFNFQHGDSYWCSLVTIACKCSIAELWTWDRWMDRWTAIASHHRRGITNNLAKQSLESHPS